MDEPLIWQTRLIMPRNRRATALMVEAHNCNYAGGAAPDREWSGRTSRRAAARFFVSLRDPFDAKLPVCAFMRRK